MELKPQYRKTQRQQERNKELENCQNANKYLPDEQEL